MKALPALLVGSIAFLTPMAATSQSDQGQLPDLLGAWQCDEAPLLFRDGEWTTVNRTVDVVEQRGALFLAVNHWALAAEHGVSGHYDGQLSIEGQNPWIGVIGFGNQTFQVTAHNDGHLVQGWLLDDNTFEIAALEPGEHAWVHRTTCRRDEGE